MEAEFAGKRVVLDASGALYMPEKDLLIVADLHLEKGSFFAARGNPLPCYDTRDTLNRLAALIDEYRPGRMICLGDSFHDGRAGERMSAANMDLLCGLVGQVGEWCWVTGNHDPVIACLSGQVAERVVFGALTLSHLPVEGVAPSIAGHFHPKLAMTIAGQNISGRCFVIGEELMLLPAFGAYTGGLNVRDAAIGALFGIQPRRYVMCHGGKLWPFASRR